MTTQQPDTRGNGSISLDVLSPEEAGEVLKTLVGAGRITQDLEASSTIPLLCEWFGYLSLGLQLVGQYLAETPDLSLSEMLKRLEAQEHRNETLDSSESQRQPRLSTTQQRVNTILELIWQELHPITQQMSQLLSLFAPTVWRWQWVEFASQSLNWTQIDIDRAKNQLHKWHWIESVTDRQDSYKIHPLIRKFLRKKLTELESSQTQLPYPSYPSVKAVFNKKPECRVLQDQFPSDNVLSKGKTAPDSQHSPPLSTYPYTDFSSHCCLEDSQSYLPSDNRFTGQHRKALNPKSSKSASQEKSPSKPKQELVQGDDIRWAFAATLVEIVQQISDSPTSKDILSLKEALPHLQEIAKTLQAAVRAEDLLDRFDSLGKFYKGQRLADLLWLFDRLGRFYKSQGLYTSAEPWFVQCLSVAKAALGEEHLDVGTSLNNLAGLYYCQRRYSEAQPLYQQALELRIRLLGNNHLDVATSLSNLASVYYAQGDYSEAEPLYHQALELRKRLLGNNHLDVAACLNSLGLLYYAQGRYTEAEPLYLQALELRKHFLKNSHPDVATSLNNLAGLYNAQKRYKEAETLLVQALKLSERVLGVNHPNTVIFQKNLAVLRSKLETSPRWWQRLLQTLKD